MSLTSPFVLVGLLVSHVVVAAVALWWGKSHPSAQSKVAAVVSEVKSKL
jgi:hypothetical protein